MKLSEVQQKLKAPKGQFNSFGKYSYRNCEDILEALKPILNGEATVVLYDEIVQTGDRYYVKATAEFKGEDSWRVTAYAREAESKKGMDESQITGSASSYARKYALNGLFAIDDTKDADTRDNTQSGTKSPAKNVKASQEQLDMIDDLLVRTSTPDDKVLKHYGVKSFKDLTEDKANTLINQLKSKLK